MTTYTSTIHTIPRQGRETQIVVLSAAERYVRQMEKCHQLAYGYSPAPWEPEALTAEKFRQHIRLFPEGQFTALEAASDTVIGTSSNMRLDVDLNKHSVKSWAEITNDG
jgi:hypothetical protein